MIFFINIMYRMSCRKNVNKICVNTQKGVNCIISSKKNDCHQCPTGPRGKRGPRATKRIDRTSRTERLI